MWIGLTYQGTAANSEKDLPVHIRSEHLAGFRPLSCDPKAGSVVYFNGMHVVVRESCDEIQMLVGDCKTAGSQQSVRTAA